MSCSAIGYFMVSKVICWLLLLVMTTKWYYPLHSSIYRQSSSAGARYSYTAQSSQARSRYSNYMNKGGMPMAASRWPSSHPSNYENAHTLPKQWRQTMLPNRDSFGGDSAEHIYETPASAAGSVLYHTLDPEVVKMQREKRYRNNESINDRPSSTLNRGSISRTNTNRSNSRQSTAYLSW